LFTDPQELDWDAATYELPRVGADLNAGAFRGSDGKFELNMSHAYGKRTRRVVRLDYKILAADVMDSSLNVPYSMAVYTVVDVPNVGIGLTAQSDVLNSYLEWMTNTSNANALTWLQGQS
jgi:hypothetical protein